ncbi:hypothetical protein [Mycolicibacterium sp. 050158]|jgi:hypothetical protein|uniref:hypothetical protein n=1 Tax=Mycolicibacterium sp. 050158 TaxID=3090602 RepID=UPI00299CE77B|nr:hypothetical protein [Mycolicibacterium sp. 050158]MDX1888482.1 hypothetical protein [Mycolicibacterium sp. 050158]
MIADTSHIHAFGVAQLGQADVLGAVAADLTAATVAPDAFGAVGADFLTALNEALTRDAALAAQLAERLTAARATADATADAYRIADGRAISPIQD